MLYVQTINIPLQRLFKPPSLSIFFNAEAIVNFDSMLTCRKILTLSNGAVQVRETAPDNPPATKFRHHKPTIFNYLNSFKLQKENI